MTAVKLVEPHYATSLAMYDYRANEEREKHFDVISNSKNTKEKNGQKKTQKTSCLSCDDSEVLESSFCSHTTLEQRKILEISLRCHPKQTQRM